ncbi:MAG: prolyl oligopeptidase family serine peptidase [Ignavibacteriaceae bacterium]
MKEKFLYLAVPLLILWITGCSSNKNGNVPNTPKDTVTTNYFGTSAADPYRWLEDGTSPKVKQWINEQNNYAEKTLSGFPQKKSIESRIKTLDVTSVNQFDPKVVNDQLFFMQSTPPQAQPVIAFKTWPNGETKVLVDPGRKGKGVAITGFWPSPKGNFLAYGLAVGGNEATTIHILNVKTGESLSDSLIKCGGGATPTGMVWDANEKGLTYVRLPMPGSVPESESQFYAALYHHFLNKPQNEDKLVFGKGLSKVAEYTFIPSYDGKEAAMFVHFGDGNPDYVYLRKGIDKWNQVLDTSSNVRVASETNAGAAWDGDYNLLVITYNNTLRGKLLSISLKDNQTDLVPQEAWALNSIATVKDGFLLVKVKGPDWKVDHYNNQGKLIRTINLPKTGIGIGTIASSSKLNQAIISYSGWIIPNTWAQYNTETGDLQTIFKVKPSADYSKVKYNVIEATSKDGTKIPVTILAMDNITPNGQRPTIVYGYGGFGIPTKPHFIGPYLVWLENGGVFAYANIRGGGEFGEGWHESGMLGNKQNVFDDMYAAAESLVKNNWTNSQHLGIMGGSNGGLLMGAELTQHPDAFKAVVSFVGIYDMLRAELFPNGQYNISEYGTSTNKTDFKWLYAYSPYHNVKPSTSYPATLLETGINDPRVASWQSRKFAAALQASNTSDNPIILITRMNEGHGVTASFSQRVGNTAAAITFFANELGLTVK